MNQAEVERVLGLDEKSRRRFENMMCGYFGLRSCEDLYRLREVVEKMREVFVEICDDIR